MVADHERKRTGKKNKMERKRVQENDKKQYKLMLNLDVMIILRYSDGVHGALEMHEVHPVDGVHLCYATDNHR